MPFHFFAPTPPQLVAIDAQPDTTAPVVVTVPDTVPPTATGIILGLTLNIPGAAPGPMESRLQVHARPRGAPGVLNPPPMMASGSASSQAGGFEPHPDLSAITQVLVPVFGPPPFHFAWQLISTPGSGAMEGKRYGAGSFAAYGKRVAIHLQGYFS